MFVVTYKSKTNYSVRTTKVTLQNFTLVILSPIKTQGSVIKSEFTIFGYNTQNTGRSNWFLIKGMH